MPEVHGRPFDVDARPGQLVLVPCGGSGTFVDPGAAGVLQQRWLSDDAVRDSTLEGVKRNVQTGTEQRENS